VQLGVGAGVGVAGGDVGAEVEVRAQCSAGRRVAGEVGGVSGLCRVNTARLTAALLAVPLGWLGSALPALATLALLTALVITLVVFESLRHAQDRDRDRDTAHSHTIVAGP